MFGHLNKVLLPQCLITHRKHVKRRLVDMEYQMKCQYSSGKFSKLGNLYTRLGLNPEASQNEIKDAYYNLSKEYHPDRNVGNKDSASKFRSISEAYEILGNVKTRAQYDRETPYGKMFKRKPTSARTGPTYQPNSSFTEKDEEFEAKIRFYRDNMRKKAQQPKANAPFRGENVFDFETWYQAHFHDRYNPKQRKFQQKTEAEIKLEAYREKLRILDEMRRPPKRYTEREPLSDIDIQMMELQNKQIRKELWTTFWLFSILIVATFTTAYIIDQNGSHKREIRSLPSTENSDDINKQK